MKLIECHVCNGRRERVNDEISRLQIQHSFHSRTENLDKGKVKKTNAACHSLADGIIKRGSSGAPRELNNEGSSKPSSDEGGDFETLDLKIFCPRRRRNNESTDE